MSISTRQRRVEEGLLAALQVADRPAETYGITERMQRYRIPALAVAAIDDGEVAWATGYGAHATTLFQAASISKAVAAVGVLALVEHGVLHLDDDVNVHLRNWHLPASEHTAERPVTLRHLLSHTAGLTVPGFPGYPVGTAVPSVPDLLSGRDGSATPAVESFAVPGTVSQYSGGGSTIVQQLVCDVTGHSFADLMHELVLAPLGMVDSAYEQPLAPARAARAAVAHDDLGNPVPGGFHVYPELQAAGLWTTAVDLARWVIGVQQILRGERSGPISTETARLMVTPVLDHGPFGLGPELDGEGALRRFGHSGRNEGFNSQADGLIELPVGGVVMATGQAASMVAEVRRALAAEYGWGPLDQRTLDVVEVDPAVLRGYTGRYAGPFGRPMRLQYADGELFSPASYGRRRMFPLSATTFVDEETGATLEIEHDGTAVRRIAVLIDGTELMAFDPVSTSEEHST